MENITTFLNNNINNCCKKIYETYILEQSKEIEYLKLENFWLKYGVNTFNNALQIFNLNKVKCKCINCIMANRYNKNKYINDPNQDPFKCKFKIKFELYLKKCNLHFNDSNNIELSKYSHNVIKCDYCSNSDTHFENGFRHDWTNWRFGKKLLNAKSINDIEIIKYKQLIDKILQNEIK